MFESLSENRKFVEGESLYRMTRLREKPKITIPASSKPQLAGSGMSWSTWPPPPDVPRLET
jgi:hypothetical protein